MTVSLSPKLEQIRQELPNQVRLIAVSKHVSVEAIQNAYELGIRDFAENRIQEALSKQEQLRHLTDICWHFIGHIQSNKAKKVLANFSWIHSCDSLALAQRLNRLAGELSNSPSICLQVKTLPDPNKYGWHTEQLLADLPLLDQCENLKIRGLMTILPLGLDSTETLAAFNKTSLLASQIQQQSWSNIKIEQLSMGMSADYHLAVKAGATMIRLGRAVFGKRNATGKPKYGI